MRCLRNNSKWLVLGQVLFFFACSLSPEARLTIVPQQVEVPDIVVITFEIDSQCLEIELERIEVIIQNQTTAELWDPEKMTEVENNKYQYEFEVTDPGRYYVQVQALDVDLNYHVVEWDYFTATETSVTTTSVANTPPTIILTKPLNGEEFVSFPCEIVIQPHIEDAEDDTNDMTVDLYSNGDWLGQGYYFKISLSAGNHELTAVVTDSDGATNSVVVKIVVHPFYFYDREDAAYSPHGFVPYGETVCYGNYCIREIEPWDHSLIGVFDRDTDQLLYTIDESHGSYNNIKGLAISDKYLAIMFHSGYNSGIWVRKITTGELVTHIAIDRFWHQMVFDDESQNIVVGGGCNVPIYYAINSDFETFMLNSGVNYPWLLGRYGWCIGINPWSGLTQGFSSVSGKAQLEADFSYLASKNVKVVRVFIFCDLRTGLVYDLQNNIVGPDNYVMADMQALLDTAEKYDLRVMPVLFDYLLARSETVNGVILGHPEFIANPVLKDQLFTNLLEPFLAEFGNHQSIHSWDILNERKWIDQVPKEQVENFVKEIAQIIYAKTTDVLVTEGVSSRCDLDSWLIDKANLVQFHYFDYMEPDCPFSFSASLLSYSVPIIIGEAEPTTIEYKLSEAFKNGYDGILFWSLNGQDGFDFRSVADQYQTWFEK